MLDRLFGRGGQPPAAPPPAPPRSDAPEDLAVDLDRLVVRANAAAGRLGPAVSVQVRRVEDVLREMLRHAVETQGRNVHEMILISSTIRDYLPTSLDAFLALPEAFVKTHRNAAGLSPVEDLLLQLELLESGIREAVVSIYAGNAQKLESQGRFLHTKFSKSDLEIR